VEFHNPPARNTANSRVEAVDIDIEEVVVVDGARSKGAIHYHNTSKTINLNRSNRRIHSYLSYIKF
jgi:hypothetical protein